MAFQTVTPLKGDLGLATKPSHHTKGFFPMLCQAWLETGGFRNLPRLSNFTRFVCLVLRSVGLGKSEKSVVTSQYVHFHIKVL